MKLRHPSSLQSVTVHQPNVVQRGILTAVLVVAYGIILQQCYVTIGQPYEQALREIERLRDNDMIPDEWEEKDLEIKKKQSKLNAIYGVASDDEVDDTFLDEPDDDDDDEDDIDVDEDEKNTTLGNSTATAEDVSRPPLPPSYLPNPWAFAALFLTVSFHILFHLMCHWLPWFKVATLYAPATKFVIGNFVQVTPMAHRGKASLEVIIKSKATGRLGFKFQRQSYEYYKGGDEYLLQLPKETISVEPAGADAVLLVASPTTGPVKDFIHMDGLSSDQMTILRDQFGKNQLSIPTPQFLTLFREQLLSPLAIFQFFTSALWMMDEYWQYFMFSVVNILIFESTTVWQRLRTMATLSGMSTKPYAVFVFRNATWQTVSSLDILPGDVISLKRVHASKGKQTVVSAGTAKPAAPKVPNASDIVPCDCVLLRGSAVTNEATLTGESVPQMKDSLNANDVASNDRAFDMSGQDRVHVLFSGTSLVATTAGSASINDIPNPPNDGCVCKVLRTGFSSSQGQLIQMIEFSTQSVSADSKETLVALGILLCFALVSASYVLKKGLQKGDRTTHELLLKCVIIITSVVPQQLPMQMALAVNTALMNLMKKGIFCTEPYRVQFAGKISACLFDKTGTLTTDQLVPVGVICADPGFQTSATGPPLKAVVDATSSAASVLGACHSVVNVEDSGLVGDPIELAGLGGVQWTYDATTQIAKPGSWEKRSQMAEKAKEAFTTLPEASKQDAAINIKKLEASIQQSKDMASASPVSSIKILNRNHFSSKLQRMSVVCRVTGKGAGKSGLCCLIKGSPEIIKTLLKEGNTPAWYDRAHRAMAEKGMRMLALAIKWCPNDVSESDLMKKPRTWVETDLEFAGFIAFECKIRADSGIVITALKESAHSVAMVTGDAPLTGYHVAKTLGICDPNKVPLLLTVTKQPDSDGNHGECEWVGIIGDYADTLKVAFKSPGIDELSVTHELITTEDALNVAANLSGASLWKEADLINVYARMSPEGKARVIRCMQKYKEHHVLMCGDGGNDVGALKQADVGLALLGGYGNSNTQETTATSADEGKQKSELEVSSEDLLNNQTKQVQKKSAEITKKANAHMSQYRTELMKNQQVWLAEEVEKGVGYFQAIKNCTARVQTEMREEQIRMQKLYGSAYSSAMDSPEGMGAMEMEEVMPVIRPGDASVAAPFTSRAPSVKAVVDLIRQGRCTLLSALQQQQIMMLQSIVSAYTISALSLEGARSSERQMMASGWLIMTASLAFSYSTPIEKMHPVRPLRSLFHPAIFVSMLGQAAIHLGCMIYAVHLATEEMGPAALKEVLEFHKKVRAGESVTDDEEEDPWAAFQVLWGAPFLPNLMNTVIFLVETAQIIGILLVNYKGRPFMLGVTENHALCLSLFLTIAGLGVCAWGVSPQLNELIHLHPFPYDEFRWQVMALVGISLLGTFIWDRLVTMIFAPRIFKAMMDEVRNTTFRDLLPIVYTLTKVVVGVGIFSSGNILLWGGAIYFLYKRRQQA